LGKVGQGPDREAWFGISGGGEGVSTSVGGAGGHAGGHGAGGGPQGWGKMGQGGFLGRTNAGAGWAGDSGAAAQERAGEKAAG